MAYQHQILRLLKALEEDGVVTNPRERSRVFFRKLWYRCAIVVDKVRRFAKGRGNQR